MNITSEIKTSNIHQFTNKEKYWDMLEFGQSFIEKLPQHIKSLKVNGRRITQSRKAGTIHPKFENINAIQNIMNEVLIHPTTINAHYYAEQTFLALLNKNNIDDAMHKFFNGWNETHKTTSLVSAKVIMRLAADAIFILQVKQPDYHLIMAHMHEVAKDDFGLGHKGHDGLYQYMVEAFNCQQWSNPKFNVKECYEFSDFLYTTGVNGYRAPMLSDEYIQSMLDAMMVSISSELWNGREYNFIAQFIEKKLLTMSPYLSYDMTGYKDAKSYILAHSNEVENRHGLHALLAADLYSRLNKSALNIERLKEVMLDYNSRVGKAFCALHQAFTENK
ncbi:MAG: hypothetical protein ACK5NC_09710 [Vibrio sp.]